jgi:hypothetical protein
VDKLLAMTRASRMTSSSTLFDAGYEQAKIDFREAILVALHGPSIGQQINRDIPPETRTAERVRFFEKWRGR